MDLPVTTPEASDTADPIALSASSATPPVDGGSGPEATADPVKATSAPEPVETSGPSAQTVTDQTNGWAERTERAVTKAQATGTPEAWEEAAKAAAVVSEMAQTMQTAADIRQSAEQMERAAEEAQRRAVEAQEAAEEAQRAVQETAKAAHEAEQAAEVAARKAAEAKQKAEQVAEATPRMAERAKEASQAAAGAKRRAQLVEEIVARAHQADTPVAWSEARRSAERAAGSEARPS
jgi:chromosome segregation ATPase